ncbi:hypothetical protein MKW98_008278 [Papaver atlanticum]|uniref:Cullin N-terminal domain-containing protein n=1 Tax=Papaver atlanticum TaxID=357466 RepID=A0AAD4XBM5_9MAGN|nr:hypothetical protein MKW98_008278 [Papaver atlanticum]
MLCVYFQFSKLGYNLYQENIGNFNIFTCISLRSSAQENRSVSGSQEHMFIKKVIDLHENYVTTCFAGYTLFHKALKEVFDVFWNKVSAGSSSAEPLSNFSNNILKKGGSEKLGDDVIEVTLDKEKAFLSFCSGRALMMIVKGVSCRH